MAMVRLPPRLGDVCRSSPQDFHGRSADNIEIDETADSDDVIGRCVHVCSWLSLRRGTIAVPDGR